MGFERMDGDVEGVSEGYYVIESVKSGQALDVGGGSKNNGAEIIQWPKHGEDNQTFKLVAAGGGYFKVQAKHSGLYWDIEGGSTNHGAKLIQYSHHGGGNQQFAFEPGKRSISNQGKAFRAPFGCRRGSTNGGAKILQWPWHGGPNQRWMLRSQQAAGFDPSRQMVISLRSHHGRFMCAESNGQIVCNREHAKEWETFTCIPMGSGKVALRSHHGKYLCAESNGRAVCNRSQAQGWETHTVVQRGGK